MFNKKCKPLNNKTPQWFKDWHSKEFVRVKVTQDIMVILMVGIFLGLIALMLGLVF